MKKRSVRVAFASIAALSLLVAACGGSDDAADEVTEETTEEVAETCTTPTPVKLQLQWFIQAQFAGYFAAQEQGFYADKVIQRHLKANTRWGSRDRRFFAESVYEIVRWERLLSHMADDNDLWKIWGAYWIRQGNELPDWEELEKRVRTFVTEFVVEPYTRFAGMPGEQKTLFFLDPTGNALEFKAFADIDKSLFAV